MHILHKHLYRTSKPEDQDKPAITIPFTTFRRVINSHQKQQKYLDISRDIKKRPYEERNSDDEREMEDLAREIGRLKKHRIEKP
jgi:hypothetical protein